MIVSIANNKGGTGKTTTAVNLGTALAQSGRRVLLVDLDPQGSATVSFGFDKAKLLYTSQVHTNDEISSEDRVRLHCATDHVRREDGPRQEDSARNEREVR